MSSRLVLRPLTRHRLSPTSPSACLPRTARSGTYTYTYSAISHVNPPPSSSLRFITTTSQRSYALYPSGPLKQLPKQNPDDDDKSSGKSKSKSFTRIFIEQFLLFAGFMAWALNDRLLKPNDLTWSDLPILLGLWGPTKPLLDPKTFTKYTIVSREQVSSTVFLLVVEPFDPVAEVIKNNQKEKREREESGEGVGWKQYSPFYFLTKIHPGEKAKKVMDDAREKLAREVLEPAWKHGLWCVEIKQPQLQVARDYTPLPPPVGMGMGQEQGQEQGQELLEDMERGRLRFLIRKMDGGEVSSYLSKLKVGDRVELRGPHLGFDVAERLGGLVRSGDDGEGEQMGQQQEQGQGQVVFLAGGTGIAPALQVARRLYGPVYEKGPSHGKGEWKQMSDKMPTNPPKMTIVWANRFREDCPDCEDVEALRKKGYYLPSSPSSSSSSAGIMPYLQDIKAHHPEQFKFACTVDTEKKFIDAKAILDAVTSTSTNKSLVKGIATTNPSCPFHSSSALVHVSDRQDHEAKCRCQTGSGSNGKNLLMVSGPEGFIARFAGPKAWAEGLERQGHVGGVAGELMRKGKMSREEWMVLKL